MQTIWRSILALFLMALLVPGAGQPVRAQGMYTPQVCSEAAPRTATCCEPAAPVVACCDSCGCKTPRCYGSVELLLWWLKGDEVPPLVTTDDFSAGPTFGALSSPSARVLLGDQLDTGLQLLPRITIGRWLGSDQSIALEGSVFWLSDASRSHDFVSNGSDSAPALFRPFFNVTAGQQDAAPIAGPGVAGDIKVDFNQRLLGAELNGRSRARENGNLRVDLLAGFRFLALDENIDISTSSFDVPAGATINQRTFESFASRNRIYCGQVGAETRYVRGLWWVSGLVKLAIGGNCQQTDISGNAVDQIVGLSGPQTLFAQTTNIGEHERSQFVFVPELGVTLGVRLLDHVDLTVGYTLIWISNVARPGSAIDFNTTTPIIGDPPSSPTNPAFAFHSDDFWAQGINLGVTWRY